MKAAVLYEHNSPMVVEEVELEEPKAREVLVKVAAAGICRSDHHFMAGDALIPLPAVLGHEGSGIVQRVGEEVTLVKPGDHVILSFVSSCGRCYFCTTGRPNLCQTHSDTFPTMFDGTTRLHKGDQRIHHMAKLACFAEQAVVSERACVPIDRDFPMDCAALIGCCVTTGVGAAILTAQIQPGSTVAVVGCGGVGLNVIQGARLVNAFRVIAVDVQEGKLEFAMKFGATHSVNANDRDAVERVKELTEGRGVDYAFEVYGSTETTEAAYAMTRRGGTLVVVGLAPVGHGASIDLMTLVRNEKTIKGSYYGSGRSRADFHRMVELYRSGRLNLDELITRRYDLDQINQAYDDLMGGEVGRGIITFQ